MAIRSGDGIVLSGRRQYVIEAEEWIGDVYKRQGKCPSCGQETMAYQNGCLTCMSCGYSKCG